MEQASKDVRTLTRKELRLLFPEFRRIARVTTFGIANLYTAWQIQLERAVLLLVLPEANMGQNEFAAQAQLLAKLGQTQGLAQVYDSGERGGISYITLEQVTGDSLVSLNNKKWQQQSKNISAQLHSIITTLAEHKLDPSGLSTEAFVINNQDQLLLQAEELLGLVTASKREGPVTVASSNLESELLDHLTRARRAKRTKNIFLSLLFVLELGAIVILWQRYLEPNVAKFLQGEQPVEPTALVPLEDRNIEPKLGDHYLTCDDSLCQRRLTGLLLNGKFDELEAIAASLRDEQQKFDTGEWMLSSFYYRLLRGDTDFMYLARKRFTQLILGWISEKPASITARVALVELYTTYGLAEWQNTATSGSSQERRMRAIDYYEQATKIAEDSDKLPQKDPHLYAIWMRAIMGLSRAKRSGKEERIVNAIYEKGRAVEPSYNSLYYETAWHYLSCWNGNPGDSEEFALRADEDTKDIQGLNIYTMIAMHFLRGSNPQRFSKFKFSWPRLKQGMNELIEAHPDSYEMAAYFTWFACRWKDREMAKKLFLHLETFDIGLKREVKNIWRTQESYDRWRAWAFDDGPLPH